MNKFVLSMLILTGCAKAPVMNPQSYAVNDVVPYESTKPEKVEESPCWDKVTGMVGAVKKKYNELGDDVVEAKASAEKLLDKTKKRIKTSLED